MSRLHYLPNAAIDKPRWDGCVQRSPNGLIYASSVFLDHLAHNWDGLVADDYELVFPVPWKSKFGIRYVTPPVFTQQLGLIGQTIPETIVHEALHLMQKHFRYGEYLFNFENKVKGADKSNFILSLDKDHEALEKNYQSDLKYDIRKALAANQAIKNGDHLSIIKLYRELYAGRFPKVSGNDYQNLCMLTDRLNESGMLIVRSAYSNDENLIAGIICVNDGKRIYLLLTASSAEGRKKKSIQLLIDSVIREYAGQKLIFDFEGSDIAGIAHFFRSFGSTNQTYTEYRWNDLPFPLNILKRSMSKKLNGGSA